VEMSIDDFQGRIIFLLNEFPQNNEILRAVKDRGFYYEIKLTNNEILQFMAQEIVPKDFKGLTKQKREKIFNYLKSKVHENTDLSLRTLIKCFQIYLSNPRNWKELVDTLIDNLKQTNKNQQLRL
ncbi:hypothetical protein J7L09_01630, partial [bacterium]|nr:hypothetical protein [bacterium]